MRSNEVIVIGAGPAGSMAATTLAARGRDVLLLERGTFPGRRKACGGLLPYQAFRECGLKDEVIETETEHEIFIFPWHRRTKVLHHVIVQRTIFDEQLVIKAQNTGVEFMSNCRVTNVTKERNGLVRVEAFCGREKKSFESKRLIFSDGVHTLSYRTLGIGFDKINQKVGFGIEYGVEAPNNGLKDYFIFFGETGIGWGYVWVFPNKHLLNVGVYVLPENMRQHPGRKNLLNYQLENGNKEFGRLVAGKRVVKRIGGYIPLEPAASLCSESAIVAGDAAGFVSPLTAGGIGTALLTGKLAGEAIDKDLSGKQKLSSYEDIIKRSAFYRAMKRESWMLKTLCPLFSLDRDIYSKLFYLWKLRNELSFRGVIRAFFYNMNGNVSQR